MRGRPPRWLPIAAAAAALAVAGPAEAAALVDAVGRRVEIRGVPRRIVSLAPSITEMLFALGAGDRVVGVTRLCDWPPAAAALPRVGGVVDPSLEAVAALEPELVVATADGNRAADVERLGALGIAVYTIDTRSLADVRRSLAALGEITGTGGRARRLGADLERRIAAVRERVRGAAGVSVFVALERRPLLSASAGTFVAEMVEIAGGRNLAASSAVKYPAYSLERLAVEDPEVIVDAADPEPLPAGAARERWLELPGGQRLRAVRDGRLVSVGQSTFFRPGPRIAESLERLADILHGDGAGTGTSPLDDTHHGNGGGTDFSLSPYEEPAARR